MAPGRGMPGRNSARGGRGPSSSAAAAVEGAAGAACSLKLPAEYAEFIGSWWDRTDGGVSHIAKAAGFIHFSLSSKALGGRKRRVVAPRHHVVVFPVRDRGRQKHHSALLTLRTVLEGEIPDVDHGSVANHLRFQRSQVAANGSSDKQLPAGSDEYVEFELLSRAHEAPSKQPLRITAGAVRLNEKTRQKESMRIDLRQCIRIIATDVVDGADGRRLIRNRWWICVETLRLVCAANCLECAALDEEGGPSLEWAICLVDATAPVNVVEALPEQNIDELARFIEEKDGRGAAVATERSTCAPLSAESGSAAHEPKSRRRRGVKDKTAEGRAAETSGESGAASASRATPAPVSATSTGFLLQPGGGREGREGAGSVGAAACAVADPPDDDPLAELLGEYRGLQEASRLLERDTKVGIIREFLDVLDTLQGLALAGKFEAKLRVLGLSKVETVGREFDPAVHRAAEEGGADAAGRTVVRELGSGWLLGDVVVRHAVVAV